MQSKVALVLVATVLATGVATVQSTEYQQPRYAGIFDAQFRAADRDGDGALSRDEARAAGLDWIVKQFDRIDTNKDGKASREELRAFLIKRLSR